MILGRYAFIDLVIDQFIDRNISVKMILLNLDIHRIPYSTIPAFKMQKSYGLNQHCRLNDQQTKSLRYFY